MPNPLTRLQNMSRGNTAVYPDSITERPTPTAPTEERYAGDNNPYRGTETHGVPDNNEPHPTPGYATRDVPARVEAAPLNVEPIPVRIVEEGGREIRTARTVVTFAGGSGNARQILGRDENRTFTRIKNPSESVTVYINHEPHTVDSAVMAGFPILPGEHYETQTQTELWASCTGGTDSAVAMIIEFSLPIGRPSNATFR